MGERGPIATKANIDRRIKLFDQLEDTLAQALAEFGPELVGMICEETVDSYACHAVIEVGPQIEAVN